ncbi:MAG: hypothetical protein J5884_00805 [Paludibacteraceae bacterium]|nr:hypothetical protein [Paludibacteraceae bacterium]
MALILDITKTTEGTSTTYTMSSDGSKEPTYGNYKLTLLELSFCKQMYKPCEILARIQISPASMSQTDISDLFKDAQVDLKDDSTTPNAIATDYYVLECIPQMTGSAQEVQLKIYSPDYLLTLDRTSAVFTGKRLVAKILTTKAETIKLPYDTSKNLSSKISAQLANGLKNDTGEYILPYTVQFDESFYEMLIRTANRWGEFVYYEGGNLIIGRKSGATLKLENLSSDYTITYTNTGSSPIDLLTNDEYLEEIEKTRLSWGHQKGDYLTAEKLYPGKVFGHNFLQGILNMKGNIFDYGVDTMYDFVAGNILNDLPYYGRMRDNNNDKYFPDKPSDPTQYDSSSSNKIMRPYSVYANNGGLTANYYVAILKHELDAGKEILCVNLGTEYKHVALGDTITNGDDDIYLVTRVESKMEESLNYTLKQNRDDKGVIVNTLKSVSISKSLHFYAYAVKKTSTAFYPPMLPTGHVRFSGPQKAIIKDTDDPKINARYRIQYPWQKEYSKDGKAGNNDDNNSNNYSPWLPVAHEMLAKNSGSIWMMEPGTEVMVNYHHGNVELPYIVGAIQTEAIHAPQSAEFHQMDLSTPAKHMIRLNDGYGGGVANFLASMMPLSNMIKGLNPSASAFGSISGYSKYYEGGMELTDAYGIYTIKGSSDERNITISSPYGDVNINAFTGITVSAPNGDVRIVGKNVNIEAGNKLSIESGKNIEYAFAGNALPEFGEVAMTRATDAGMAVLNKVTGMLDLSLFRNILEVFLRPVDGTFSIKSNRYLLLEAGKGEAIIKTDRYPKHMDPFNAPGMQCYLGLVNAIQIIDSHVDEVFNTIEAKEKSLAVAKTAYNAKKIAHNTHLKAAYNDDGSKIISDVYAGGSPAGPTPKTYTDSVLIDTTTNPTDDVKSEMVYVANELATKAYDYFDYIKKHLTTTANAKFFNKDTIPATCDDNGKTKFNDLVKNAAQVDHACMLNDGATAITLNNFSTGVADFTSGGVYYTHEQQKKISKRAWFKAVFNAASKLTFPYKPKEDGTWSEYVDGLVDKTDWLEQIWKIATDLYLHFKDASFGLFIERARWKTGKGGQIVFSDQPSHSITFNTDGTPNRYENENTQRDESGLSTIKQMLHNWDD